MVYGLHPFAALATRGALRPSDARGLRGLPTFDQEIGEDNPLGHLATRDLPEQKCRSALSAASRHIPFPSHANFRHQPLASSGTSSKEDFSFLGAGHGACDQPVEPTCTGSK